MRIEDIKKIIVDGNQKLNYSGFYLHGIRELFSDKLCISHSFLGTNDKEHTFALRILKEDNSEVNVIVDFHDSMQIDHLAMDWCQYYYKINYNSNYLKSELNKLDFSKLSIIPPSFGIQALSLMQTLHFISKSLLKWNPHTIHTIKNALRAYYKRLPLSFYQPQSATGNYIFFVGSIWNKLDSIKITLQRAEIIRAVKNMSDKRKIKFEGGLVNIGYKCDYIPDLENLMFADSKISLKSYLNKTKKSLFAFNNPAVFNCHGWKIGEFMALGKAVLSYPAMNDLDPSMAQYNAVEFVSDKSELEGELNRLIDDVDARKELENNASRYWDECMSPVAVISKIIKEIT